MLNMNGDTAAAATPAAVVFSTLRRDVPARPLQFCLLCLLIIASHKLPIFPPGPEMKESLPFINFAQGF
jgi:hypothetical protein